jgi:hypothetical protein
VVNNNDAVLRLLDASAKSGKCFWGVEDVISCSRLSYLVSLARLVLSRVFSAFGAHQGFVRIEAVCNAVHIGYVRVLRILGTMN